MQIVVLTSKVNHRPKHMSLFRRFSVTHSTDPSRSCPRLPSCHPQLSQYQSLATVCGHYSASTAPPWLPGPVPVHSWHLALASRHEIAHGPKKADHSRLQRFVLSGELANRSQEEARQDSPDRIQGRCIGVCGSAVDQKRARLDLSGCRGCMMLGSWKIRSSGARWLCQGRWKAS